MLRIIALGIVSAVVMFGFIIGPGLQERQSDRNTYLRQREAQDLYTRDLAIARKEALQGANIAATASLLTLGVVLAFGITTVVLYWSGRRAHTTYAPLVKSDSHGRLPVSRAALTQGDYDRVIHRVYELLATAEVERAIHQPGQNPHSYSPKIDMKPVPNQPTIIDAVPTERTDSTVPTFAELLAHHKIGYGNPLHLGYDLTARSELHGSWTDLYSTAIGGLPGTGKTTTQRFLACQTALHGARFVVVDRHAEAGEDSLTETLLPLQKAFLCEPASSDTAIINAVKLVSRIGDRRVHGDRDRTPIILWLDEMTGLLNRSTIGDNLTELLEQIAQEYRKVAVYATCSAQIWTANRTGDSSALRDSLASVIAHRMKRSQARMLLPTEEARDNERLETGTAILWRSSGITSKIAIPNTTARDVITVAHQIEGRYAPVSDHLPSTGPTIVFEGATNLQRKRSETAMKAPEETGNTAHQSPEMARIVSLFAKDGKSVGEIVRELWGDIKGTPYNEKRSQVEKIIRDAVKLTI